MKVGISVLPTMASHEPNPPIQGAAQVVLHQVM